MSIRSHNILLPGRRAVSDGTLYLWSLVCVLPVPLLLLWKPFLAVAYAAAPAALLVIANGPVAIYLLTGATFLFLPLHIGVVLLPADVMALILVMAYVADLLLRGENTHKNPLAGPFIIYIFVLLLSVAFQGFTAMSVRYVMRQILLLATFLAVAHFGNRVKVKYVLGVFMASAILNSLYSLGQFAAAGGSIRAFGLAGLGYGDHVMIGFIIAAVMYLWSRDLGGQVLWGLVTLLMMGAIAATQTRASAITAGWSLVGIVIIALLAGKRFKSGRPNRRLMAAVAIAAVILPILALYTPAFEGIMHRFGRLGLQPSETIRLRFSLWKAAFTAFWGHPILGIGAGNFTQVSNWVPEVRFDPIFYLVSGLGTHVQVITALAETGILGFSTLVVFLLKAVKVAYNHLAATAGVNEIAMTQCLFAIALAVFGSSLYAGSWFWGNNSYHMAVFFGLIASYHHQAASVVAARQPAV